MSLANQMKLEDEISTFELKITSITQTPDGTQVNATGTVGRYGKVWLSYDFTPNSEQEHMGSFVGIGRGLTLKEPPLKERRGVYVGDGLKGTVYSLDDVTDGKPNFCIEKWDLEKETIELSFLELKDNEFEVSCPKR